MKDATRQAFQSAMEQLGKNRKIDYMRLAYEGDFSGIDSEIPKAEWDSCEVAFCVTDCTTFCYSIKDLRDLIPESKAQAIIALVPMYTDLLNLKEVAKLSEEERAKKYTDFSDQFDLYFPE